MDRRDYFLVWQVVKGDIRVVVEFIHNGGRELISGAGYRAKTECGRGLSTHGAV